MSAPITDTPTLPATLRLGAVDLTVLDLDRAVAWYQRSLGLRVHRQDLGVAELGDGTETTVIVHEDPQPLDIDDLLATVQGEDVSEHVGTGLRMGHLHLHVGDIEQGLAFYRDTIGFEQQALIAG